MANRYEQKPGFFRGTSSSAVFAIAFSAVLYWLGFANPWKQLPFTAFFLPAALYVIAFYAESYKQAAFHGWLANTIGSALALYWVSVPMHDFAGAPWVAGFAAALLLGAYLGLYGALFALLVRFFRKNSPMLLALLGAMFLWGALEWLKGFLFSGFPWLTLSVSLTPWPVLVQGASLLGAYGLSAAYAGIVLGLLEGAGSCMRFYGKQRWLRAGLAVGLVAFILLGLSVYSSITLRTTELRPAWQAVRVGAVQGNMAQENKWEPSWHATTVRQYLQLSHASAEQAALAVSNIEQPAADKDARFEGRLDLLVWPETATPFYFQSEHQLSALIRDFIGHEGVPLVMGTPAYELRAGVRSYYNRMVLLDKQGRNAGNYDKRHLVPFGEYMPLQLDIPFAKEFLQGFFFSSGTGTPVIEVQDFYRGNLASYGANAAALPKEEASLILGPLICYEAIFPYLAQERVAQGANLLVSISNDAWFGYSPAAEQHLQLAAMRAVEQGRYLVRATNTGISAFINNHGEVLQRSNLFQAQQLTGTVYIINEKTLFHQWYKCILVLLFAVPLVAGLWGGMRLLRHRV